MNSTFSNHSVCNRENSRNSFDGFSQREFLACEQKLYAELNHLAKAIDSNNDQEHGYKYGYASDFNPSQNLDSRMQSIYRAELRMMAERLLIEMLFMAAVYRYYEQFGQYYSRHQHGNYWLGQHFGFHFRHLRTQFRHWASPLHHLNIRPQEWMAHAEQSGQYLGRQWNNWSNDQNWHNWGKTAGMAGRLIAEAEHSVGRPVWAFTKFASVCQTGYLGCAATVSDLLQHAGVKINGSASVYGVVNQLSELGWQRVRISDRHQFRPGDVVFGTRGSHGHIGIISQVSGDQVLVCDNSSSAGTLKERTIESGGSFTPNGRFAGNLYVMRQG